MAVTPIDAAERQNSSGSGCPPRDTASSISTLRSPTAMDQVCRDGKLGCQLASRDRGHGQQLASRSGAWRGCRRSAGGRCILALTALALVLSGVARRQWPAFSCAPSSDTIGHKLSTKHGSQGYLTGSRSLRGVSPVSPAYQDSAGGVSTVAALPALQIPRLGSLGESFSIILLSELGDKTFFLTMIIALRRGRRVALLVALASLWSMTIISTGIGVLIRQFPSSWVDSEFWVRLLAAILMVYFGIQSLFEAASAGGEDGLAEAETDFAEEEGKLSKRRKVGKVSVWELLRFTALLFFAEWGDRSMFATVALAAAAKNPAAVVVGGCAGHLLASMFAVLSGELLQRYLSDRIIKTVGGILFVVFGVTTLVGVY